MKKTTTAVLLSGLVFPGLGHLYLRRYLPGLLLITGTASLFYFLLSGPALATLEIAEEIRRGAIPLSIDDIRLELALRSNADTGETNIAYLMLLVLWLTGIFDALRIGRSLDRAKGP